MIKNIYKPVLVFTTLFLQLAITSDTYAQLPAGTLDTTFSVDGKVVTALGTLDDEGKAVAVQADGKIVVAGSTKVGALNRFGLVRYNNDGTLDNGFGSSGKINTSMGPGNSIARAIALQTDGKIVVAGNMENQTYSNFAIARYTTSGTLDNTFGNGGKVLTALDLGFDLAYAVAIQPDGKIVAAGISYDTLFNGEFGVARYNANGTPDNTFGTNGKVRTSVGTTWDQAQTLAIQPDGKIILAGRTATNFAMIRYTSTGILDPSFGSNGIMTFAIGANSDIINSIKLKSDGRIIAGGVTQSGTNYDFVLLQFDASGNLDNNFGLGGLVLADFGLSDVVYALTTEANGNIILAGSSGSATSSDFTLARYDSLGNPDYTFYNQAFVTTSFGGSNAGANGVAIQPDGKIVASGNTKNGTYNSFATARYFPLPVSVGINDLTNDFTFSLVPAPASNSISIESVKAINEITISDLAGQKVYACYGRFNNKTIDITKLKNGIYFVNASSGSNHLVNKLVVQK